jgi:hypothetical protein
VSGYAFHLEGDGDPGAKELLYLGLEGIFRLSGCRDGEIKRRARFIWRPSCYFAFRSFDKVTLFLTDAHDHSLVAAVRSLSVCTRQANDITERARAEAHSGNCRWEWSGLSGVRPAKTTVAR